MLKMTIYRCTLSTTVIMELLYPSTVMSKPWRKYKNKTKIYSTPTLPQNQLVSTPYPNALFKVTSCPINLNGCTTSFRKTLASSDPVLLTSPVLPLLNTILILAMLNPSKREHTVPAISIVRTLRNRCRRCSKTASSNPVLVPGPVLLSWSEKQIKLCNSV